MINGHPHLTTTEKLPPFFCFIFLDPLVNSSLNPSHYNHQTPDEHVNDTARPVGIISARDGPEAEGLVGGEAA